VTTAVAPTPDLDADRAFGRAMLPHVSRTFALCIRLLPPDLQEPVTTAYLLCRIADTIEDAPALDADEKDRLLRHFARTLAGDDLDAAPLAAAFADAQDFEGKLAAQADTVLRVYRALPEVERSAIRPWVREMAGGMAAFALRHARDGALETLDSVEELDQYCYYVAGTVGHLLTGLFRSRMPRLDPTRADRLDRLATSFGIGLQLTNIIKDVADDRRRGWSFVPRDLCEATGIRPEELQLAEHRGEAREVMTTLIAKARRHLHDALAYSATLPVSAYRVRIFCLTSLYFAVRTLRLAERDPQLLDPRHKVKITRGAVYRTVIATYLVAPFNLLVRAYFRRLDHAR
jgi:farnesyl-diphosphate farnesyltransferase